MMGGKPAVMDVEDVYHYYRHGANNSRITIGADQRILACVRDATLKSESVTT